MKKRLMIICAFLLTCLLFSLFSGCKLKQKHQQKSKDTEESASKLSEQYTVTKVDSSISVKTDQSKLKTDESVKSSSKQSIEITIELDSNKKFPEDMSGDLSLSDLVNTALKNAKSIRIKAEQHQTKEGRKVSTANVDQKEQNTDVKKSEVDSNKTLHEQKKKVVQTDQTKIIKDSTVSKNSGSLWPWLIGAIILVYLIYRFK